MSVLVVILLPLATAILILAVRLLRPRFAYHWLVAAGGGLATWMLAWGSRPTRPLNLPLANWQPRILVPISPALLFDAASWTFLVALATLLLATLCTDLARAMTSRRSIYGFDLAAYLSLTAFSMLAVLSGNLLTLALSWTLLGMIEAALRLSAIQDGMQSQEIVLALALRLASVATLVWAGLIAYAAGAPLSLTTIAPQTSTALLAAAGLHLGLIPLHAPVPRQDPPNVGMTTLLRLAPAAPALILCARVGNAGAPAPLTDLFLLAAGLALIYAGINCANAPSIQVGFPYWTLGMASLALACAALGKSAASLAWGTAALFAGGVFSLATSRARGLALPWLLGLAGISALPFSPTWEGAGLYALPLQPLLAILLLGQGLFLAGAFRQVMRQLPASVGAERWVMALYFSGLLSLPASHFAVSWSLRSQARIVGQYQVGWIETGISMVALGLALGALPFYLRRSRRKFSGASRLAEVLSLSWLYRTTKPFYRLMERLVGGAGQVLEGRAGILWTLLALALIVSLFVSLALGG